MNQKRIEVYTDGSCLKNPGGRGGWAVIFEDGRQISGGEISTTNNRLELTAVIEALKAANLDEKLTLYTDSNYVKNGITSWIKNWKLNNWKTAAKTPVLNQDLWKELDKLANQTDVKFEWVQGHSGNPMNEDCDYLAKQRANDSDQSIKRLNFPAESPKTKIDTVDKTNCAEKTVTSVKLVYKGEGYVTVAADYLKYLIAHDIHETKTLENLKFNSIKIANYFAIKIPHTINNAPNSTKGIENYGCTAMDFLLKHTDMDRVIINYSDDSSEEILVAWESRNNINAFQTNRYRDGVLIIEVDNSSEATYSE